MSNLCQSLLSLDLDHITGSETFTTAMEYVRETSIYFHLLMLAYFSLLLHESHSMNFLFVTG